jgi:hypothetical protein
MKQIRVGILGESFGFGPASKALAIAKALSKHPHVTVVPMSTLGVAADFLESNDLRVAHLKSHDLIHPEEVVLELGLDAAIVNLDIHWASALARFLPTYFVDSLAFMWPDSFFQSPFLKDLQCYFVQDAFNASDRLRDLNVPSLLPVGAIINLDTDATHPEFHNRHVVTIGGCQVNSLETDLTHYFSLIRQAVPPGDRLWLAGEGANKYMSDYEIRHVQHKVAISIFEHAIDVTISPGLTTVLELAALQVPCKPLPPQNYSQLHILRRLCEIGLSDPWLKLCDDFSGLPEQLNEQAGLYLTNERISSLVELGSGRAYSPKLYSPASLPATIVPDFDGAETVASVVVEECSGNEPQPTDGKI